jgi:hypothetical protein
MSLPAARGYLDVQSSARHQVKETVVLADIAV